VDCQKLVSLTTVLHGVPQPHQDEDIIGFLGSVLSIVTLVQATTLDTTLSLVKSEVLVGIVGLFSI